MPFPTKSDAVNRAVNPERTILFRLGVRFPGLYRGSDPVASGQRSSHCRKRKHGRHTLAAPFPFGAVADTSHLSVSVPTSTPPATSGSAASPWKLAALGEWASSHNERHDSPPFSERNSMACVPFSCR